MEDYIKLMVMDKFEQRLDEKDSIAYELKERLSKEAWNKVKDLFYYDASCETWLTKKPEEVIKRLEDSEWKLDTKVFKMIAGSLPFSLNNAMVFYEALKTVKRYGGAETLELLRKVLKFPAGSTVKFSKETKILKHNEDWEEDVETFLVEKNGEKYFIVLLWMTTIDDAGFVGAVWKYDDVRDVPLKRLINAVELYMASSLIFMPIAETVKDGKAEVNGQKFSYIIQKVTHNNPILGINKEWYEAFVWAGSKFKKSGKLQSFEEAMKYVDSQFEAFTKETYEGDGNEAE